MTDFRERTRLVLNMVKIEHSIFALPFAYTGVFLAAGGWPGWRVFLLLTLAMVMIRSFAMAMNRILDLRFDRLNPRTQSRPLVTGELSVRFTVVFCLVTAVLFVLACAGLNTLCLILSGPALIWSAAYSLTKRFTWLCHYFLGSVLGLAPIAGWIAFDPQFTLPAFLLFFGVLFWVAGFDILYAAQDAEFDKSHALHSVPAAFGLETAFVLSRFSHVQAALFFLLAGFAASLGWIYFLAWAVVGTVLYMEHRIVSPGDLSRLNMSFFTLNGAVAALLFVGVLLDLAL
ncbi:4-hydroxybenzoate polyprenyltransferase [Desulfonatronum thiosulfatophilum]|uniref:4-hydroxybenzoate polyprenyltransferase n=1 Tax=Desulfonatronum thiosulfatophilum TaxID=617002 RepID=A0A1G6AJD6_9BACT|nr:4-hydroxybenzoate octaprenyltransferase [Desulfonatronum thiosulfatophilum]SDB08233.1 4-hydroxybenzoate polyprenyltransferase [Desulfonatronum thiosulfatophilum]